MKNFYNISIGQLITIWIFAGLGWCWSAIEVLDSYNAPFLAGFFALFIPFALIFYTIGWWNRSKNKLTGSAKEMVEELNEVREKQGYTTVQDVSRAVENASKDD